MSVNGTSNRTLFIFLLLLGVYRIPAYRPALTLIHRIQPDHLLIRKPEVVQMRIGLYAGRRRAFRHRDESENGDAPGTTTNGHQARGGGA